MCIEYGTTPVKTDTGVGGVGVGVGAGIGIGVTSIVLKELCTSRAAGRTPASLLSSHINFISLIMTSSSSLTRTRTRTRTRRIRIRIDPESSASSSSSVRAAVVDLRPVVARRQWTKNW